MADWGRGVILGLDQKIGGVAGIWGEEISHYSGSVERTRNSLPPARAIAVSQAGRREAPLTGVDVWESR